MNLLNMPLSAGVVERICSPEQPSMCIDVPLGKAVLEGLPVINAAAQQPTLFTCLYLFALTISLAWWVDIFFFKSKKEF